MRLIEGRSFYKEPWYGSYHSMMDRCYRKKAHNYPQYGGRGIAVCEEWHDIELFEQWVKGSKYKPGMSLERINVNNGYGWPEIPKDLVVVGDNWWLERAEYDGSEWWEFKTIPKEPRWGGHAFSCDLGIGATG